MSRCAIDEALARDPHLRELEDAVACARRDLRFQEGEAPKQPAVLRAREALEAAEAAVERYRREAEAMVRARLQGEANRSGESRLASAQEAYERLQKQLTDSQKISDEAAKALEDHNRQRAALDASRKAIAQQERIEAQLTAELANMRIEARPTPRVTVAEEPHVVAGSEGNGRLTLALLAAGGLFAAGFGGLVFWEARRRRSERTE